MLISCSSQSGSNYQPPDAHVSTEMDGGFLVLADFPGSAQSAVEQAAPDNTTRREQKSLQQNRVTPILNLLPQSQRPKPASTSGDLKSPDRTHPPARTKTYPRRDRHPCVRCGFERTNS